MLEDQGQFVLYFRQDGDPDPYLCTIGYDTVGGTVTPSGASAAALGDFLGGGLILQLSSAIVLYQVDMELMTSTGVVTASAFVDYNGENEATALLQNTALLLHKHTASAGRGSKGRMFVPGVPENRVNNVGVLALDWLATLQTELDDLQTWFDTVSDNTAVVNHGEGSPLGLESDITAWSADPVCASQRRRLRH